MAQAMSNADSAAAELPGARQGTFEPRLVGIQIGRDTISRATDAALEDIEAWRTMPLDSVSPNVPRARVTVDGKREVLGIWWQQTESARFWLAVLNDLRRRGVHDVDRLGEAASLVEDASFAKTNVVMPLAYERRLGERAGQRDRPPRVGHDDPIDVVLRPARPGTASKPGKIVDVTRSG